MTQARSLRRNRTDGDVPVPGSIPPAQTRRLDEEGHSVPGTQDSELAAQASEQLTLNENAGVGGAIATTSTTEANAGNNRARFFCPDHSCFTYRPAVVSSSRGLLLACVL